MDLRPYKLTPHQVDQAVAFIKERTLQYQPFILTDKLEVGEGQNLHDRYPNGLFVSQVYADRDLGLGKAQTANLDHFRACNAGYRALYDHFAGAIAGHFGGDVSKLSFAEIGCNTGLHLFNLARMGAARCIGYDWNEMGPFFEWLNGIIGTRVEFHRSIWNRHQHRLDGAVLPEVDVMLSSVFLNHQFDPLQHIACICDHSREAVFLWLLIDTPQQGNPYTIAYNPSLELLTEGSEGHGFPEFLNNGVTISEPLLRAALTGLGFGKVIDVTPPNLEGGWQTFCKGFRSFLAIRTSPVRSTFFNAAK